MAPSSWYSSSGTVRERRSSNTTTSAPSRRLTTSNSRHRATAASATSHEHDVICAVSEGRGISPTVGLSFLNLTTCEAVLCQFADTQAYARTCHKIKVFDPSEIIFAKNAAESKLLSVVREDLEVEKNDVVMTAIDRRYWSETSGHEYLQRLALSDSLESLKLELAGKYFAMCSFAAVFKYMELKIQTTIAPHTLRVHFESSEGAMMIDTSTISALELVQNLQNSKSRHCLFGLLSQTLTKMGARMLKSNILQPSIDKTKISKRHEAVAELSSKETMFFSVREALTNFVDTDRVLAALITINQKLDFMYMEQSVNNVLMLKTFVDSIPPIFEALAGAESQALRAIHQLCDPENYLDVRTLIDYAINSDVSFSSKPAELRNQRVYAIKSGVNGFLDVARKTYKEIGSDIENLVSELQEQHQLGLKLKFDPARQFYFTLDKDEVKEHSLPEVFINTFHQKGQLQCQTLDLVKMNQKLRDAHNEVVTISDASIQTLIEETRTRIQPLFKISESLAMLDMLGSFSHMVTTQNYVKPDLLETLAIKAGRHPVRESIQQEIFIPNDVYATQQTRFQIITGCNMSGKSTYIRSVALMTVMAQVGSFIPATYASFPMIHQLFARVSTDDSIEANMSTFASEMREMAFILRNVESRSLVIVDELGRGTSTTDGLAIAIAISEALIESKAFVWFVTHFRDLPRVLAQRAGVVNLHLTVDIEPELSQMKMRYKVSEGCEEQRFYGLALAKLLGLPQEVTDMGAETSQYLHKRNEARKSNAREIAVAKRRNLVLKLKERLVQARESDRDDKSLQQWLKRLQDEFTVRMTAIDAEIAATETTDTTKSAYTETSRETTVPNDEEASSGTGNMEKSVVVANISRSPRITAGAYHGEVTDDRIEDDPHELTMQEQSIPKSYGSRE